MNTQTEIRMRLTKKQILAALPVEARRKLQRLERTSERAAAEAEGLWNKIHDLRAELDHHVVLRKQWASPNRGSQFRHVADIETDREKDLKEEIRELQEAVEEATKLAAPYRFLVSRGLSWIEAVASTGGKIAAFPTAVPEGSDVAAAVAAIRGDIASVEAKIAELESAPPPAAELKKLARESIKNLARNGAPALFSGTRNGDPVTFPSICSSGLLVWAMGDTLLSRIDALIDAEKLDGAIGTAERDKKLSKLAAERLALERQEEALVEAAEKKNIIIERRPEADVRAILAIQDL